MGSPISSIMAEIFLKQLEQSITLHL
jgi:hypothetical protein